MNVKTVKRMSKRTVSTLLSILMVISLFTVCMVGTVTTASAADTYEIRGTFNGWASGANPMTYDKYSKSWSGSFKIPSGATKGTTWGFKILKNNNQWLPGGSGNDMTTIAWDGYTEYMVVTYYPNGAFNSSQVGTKLSREPHDSAKRYAYVNAVVYNYRNNQQVANTTDSTEDNTTAPGYHVQNYWNGVEWDKQNTTRREFSDYNEQVAQWYYNAVKSGKGKYKTDSTLNATPLYQGNFRAGATGGTAGTMEPGIGKARYNRSKNEDWANYHFISVANGANRYGYAEENGSITYGSTNAVAKGLVDDTLSDLNDISKATITQNGVELPQFSETFSNSKYQWKSDPLQFPFDKEATAKGNTKYVYDASLANNNRHLLNSTYPDNPYKNFTEPDKIVAGPTVDGVSPGKHGYFPFNATDNSTGDHINNVNCFGTRFDIEFIMPSDKKIGTTAENKEELVFEFSGDDDVWVYIDGHLALDMGGSHNKAKGSINLTRNCFKIDTGYYQSDYNTINSIGKDSWKDASPVEAIGHGEEQYYDKNSELYKILQQTNQKHTLTVFYMERGEYDSNFYMSYLLPVNDKELKITQKVNGSTVNDGLRLKTMEIANKDIFVANVKTQYMDLSDVTDNMIKLPIESDFTRRTNLLASETPEQTVIMQKKANGPSYYNLKNETSGSSYSWIKSCYSWVDDSKLLDADGNVVTPVQRLATGSGVGRPWETSDLGKGAVPLLYDQSAIFYNQFSTKVNTASGGTLPEYPVVNITQDECIARFSTTADSWDKKATGIRDIQNLKQNTSEESINNSGRYVDDYYTTHLSLTGASDKNGATELNSGDECYIKENKSSFTYTHDIKVGDVTIEKQVDGSDKTENGKKTEYTFEIRYKNLFGDKATTYPAYANKTGLNNDEKEALWKAIESDDEEPWQTANLVGTREGKDADGNEYTDENNSMVASNGRFGMVSGSSVTFKGIPVGTIIQIREYSEKHPITEQESSIREVLFSGVVSENYRLNDSTKNITDNAYGNDSKKITVDITTTSAVLDGMNKTMSTIKPHTTGSDASYKMTENAQWKYTVTNSYTSVPIFYRFIDRKVENGKPTGLASDYTYFTKNINVRYEQLLNTKDSTVTEEAQEMLIDLSPQIINVICTYGLTKNGKYDPKQYEAYSKRATYVENLSEDQFELVELTDKVNAVLDAMYGTTNPSNTEISDQWYKALNENCETGGKTTNVVGMRDTLKNIIDRVIADYKSSHNNAAPTKANIKETLRNDNYFLCDNKNGELSNDKYYLIQVTYANTLRRYDVDVQLYAPTGGITAGGTTYNAGGLINMKYSVPFNGISNIATQDVDKENYTTTGGTYDSDMQYAGDSKEIADALKLDETANELFRIKLSDGNYIYFAYWERMVSYFSGDNVITEWTPVSTNFNYHLRVNDHVRLRAVYQDKNGKRYVPGNSSSGETFKPIDSTAENPSISSLYSPLKKTIKNIYWQIRDGNKYYRGKTDGAKYTVPAIGGEKPVEPIDKDTFERTDLFIDESLPGDTVWEENTETPGKGTVSFLKQGEQIVTVDNMTDQQYYQVKYNVPNPSDKNGYGKIGYGVSATDRAYNSYSKEVLNSTTGVSEKQDRTMVDIVFGSPTSDDNDKDITQTGYMLFKSPKYEDPADAVYGNAKDFREQLTNGEANVRKFLEWVSSQATSRKFTASKNSGNQKVTYTQNGKTYDLQCSMAPVGDGANGTVKLTNKNRYNVVFDIINNESSRQNYYTVFLVMKRGNTFYISPTPATFNLRDVDPAIRNSDGQRAYLMKIRNGLNTDATGEFTKPMVGSMISNYTTATNGRTLSFTNRITTWIDSDGTPYTGELKSLQIGKYSVPQEEVDSIKDGGTLTKIFTTDNNTYIDDPTMTSYFDVIARYERKILGSQLDVSQKAHTSVSTVVKDSSGTETPAFNKTYESVNTDTTHSKTDGNKGQVVPYNHKLTVTVTADKGYIIDDSEVPNEVTGDTNISITKPNDSTWIAEVTTVNADDSATDNLIAKLLANLPKAVEKSYTFKIKTSPESLLTNISVDGTAITSEQISSNNEYVVTVLNSQLNENGQKNFILRATTDVTDYDFSGWSDGTTTGNTGEVEYTFDANTMNGNTVTANYISKAVEVTFTVNLKNLSLAYWGAAEKARDGGNGKINTGTAGIAKALEMAHDGNTYIEWNVKYTKDDKESSVIADVKSTTGTGDDKTVTYAATIPANSTEVYFESVGCTIPEDKYWDQTYSYASSIQARTAANGGFSVSQYKNIVFNYDTSNVSNNFWSPVDSNPPQKFKVTAY